MNSLLLTVIAHPDPVPVPAPPALVWFLLVLTFLLHLIPMNFLLGGSFLAAVSRLRSRTQAGAHHAELGRFLRKAMPVTAAATISFGVAPLLLVQVLYGRLFFSSSVLMAWFWIAVVPILIVAYYGTYLLSFKEKSLGRAAGPAGWLIALLFAAIAFIYSNNMSLMLRPGIFLEKYRQSATGFHLNLDDPTLFARYLHMLVGALAVSGMIVAVYGLLRRTKSPEFGAWAVRYGSLWFSICTALNMVSGFWWLMALPRETMLRFMGQNLVATISLTLGIAAGLGALIMMLLASQAREPAGLIRGSAYSLLLTLVLMILARDQVRRGALEAAQFRPMGWIESQWPQLTIFLVLLVAAFAVIAWMVVKLARSSGEDGAA